MAGPERTPTEKDFRDCGYTAAAINYPLSERAVRMLAHKNRLSFEQYINISPGVWYAPSEASRLRCEAHGLAHEEGRLHINEEGRWYVDAKTS